MYTDQQIESDLASQLARLDAAILRGDGDERWNFRCAAALYWQLKQRWQFDDLGPAEESIGSMSLAGLDAGSRRADRDRNVIRKVRFRNRPNGVAQVLKCELPYAPSTPMYELLSAWNEAGLPAAKPYAGGFEDVYVDGHSESVEYLLTEFIEERSRDRYHFRGTVVDRPLDESLDVVREIVEFIQPFHASNVSIPNTQTWADCWFATLYKNVATLTTRYPEVGWESSLDSTSWRREVEQFSAGHVLLHGNLKERNVLIPKTGSRKMVLIDPMGGIVGPREWDIGQLCVLEIGDPGKLPEAFQAARDADLRASESATDYDAPSPLRVEVLAYGAAMQALFSAFNVVTAHSYEHADAIDSARSWVQTAKWALTVAREGSASLEMLPVLDDRQRHISQRHFVSG